MLTHPTLDLLHTLGLHGMAKGFKELGAQPEAADLAHAEWLALLLEHEATLRRQKKFESRARAAKLRQAASVEDVDYRAVRASSCGPRTARIATSERSSGAAEAIQDACRRLDDGYEIRSIGLGHPIDTDNPECLAALHDH
jgi:hypothetical protein